MRKIGAKRAARMTAEEIGKAPFKGAGPGTLRGLSDAFTVEGLRVIAYRHDLPLRLSSWAFDALDNLNSSED